MSKRTDLQTNVLSVMKHVKKAVNLIQQSIYIESAIRKRSNTEFKYSVRFRTHGYMIGRHLAIFFHVWQRVKAITT